MIRIPLAALAATVVACASAGAQTTLPFSAERVGAGSALHTAADPGPTPAAGVAASGAFTAEITLSTAPAAASSALYSLGGATLLTSGDGASDAPVLVAATPRAWPSGGGSVVTLRGLGLDSGGTPVVTVEGLPAPVLSASPTAVQIQTPELRNPLGNPLGSLRIELDSGGANAASNGLALSTPAYLQSRLARLDQSFDLTHVGQPFAVGFPTWANEVPGAVLPYPGFQGVLELVGIIVLFPAQPLDADGIHVGTFNIPDVPALIGQSLTFQSVVFDSFAPLVASFTNVTAVTVQP